MPLQGATAPTRDTQGAASLALGLVLLAFQAVPVQIRNLNYGSFISLAGMERITGINQKQLWAYMHGRKKPRQAQKEKITNALHRFANELAAAVML